MDLHLPPDMNASTYQSRDNVSDMFHRSNDSSFSFASPSLRPSTDHSGGPEFYTPSNRDAGLRGSPAPSSPSTFNVVEPLVVDTLAKDFNLDQQQCANLHGFVKGEGK
jgi:hypothetical protein